ncbi:MAG: Na/Pi cotransporter family protein [Opitutales bacterium]
MEILFSAVAAVMLYLHSLRDFAREVTTLGGERLRGWLRTLTGNRFMGALTGATFAALVQSSSVVNFVTMGLAERRALPMRSAWTVMIGANVGTTVTAWLIAFKLTALGPVLMTAGGFWSLLAPQRLRPYGKPIFHFGLIFLALELIRSTLLPLAQTPEVLAWRDNLSTPPLALAFGACLTMLVQSSSVVVGMTVLSVAGGLLAPELSIWVVVGANLGTGWVALATAWSLGPFARRLATFNAGLDLCGLALFAVAMQHAVLPLLGMVAEPGRKVALAHSAFNLSASGLALLLLPWIWSRLEKFVPREAR